MKLLFILALAATSSACLADTVPQVRKAIQARYAEMSRAFAAKDAKGFESVFADDFTAKAPGRPKMSRADTFKDFEGQMNAMSDVQWKQTIKSIKLEGNVAHVKIETEMNSKAPMRGGKLEDFHLTSKTLNDWVKTTKGWLVRYSETSDLQMSIAGQPLKMHG